VFSNWLIVTLVMPLTTTHLISGVTNLFYIAYRTSGQFERHAVAWCMLLRVQ